MVFFTSMAYLKIKERQKKWCHVFGSKSVGFAVASTECAPIHAIC